MYTKKLQLRQLFRRINGLYCMALQTKWIIEHDVDEVNWQLAKHLFNGSRTCQWNNADVNNVCPRGLSV